jgi:hypothetical protein
LITGNAFALKGSIKWSILEHSHVQLTSRYASVWTVASPLMYNEQEPQIPSRQSWSKDTGRSPCWLNLRLERLTFQEKTYPLRFHLLDIQRFYLLRWLDAIFLM